MSALQATAVLSGTGETPALIEISDTDPFNFGVVVNTNTLVKTFTLTNNGNIDATNLNGLALAAPYAYEGGGAFPGSGGDCPVAGTLIPTGTCEVSVQFNPTASGFQSDDLEITYDDGVIVGKLSASELHGTGVGPAILDISGIDPVDFGTVARDSDTEVTFTITNSGSTSATAVTEVGLGGFYSLQGGLPGNGGTCLTTISQGTDCTVVVNLNSPANGSPSGTLTLDYDDGTAVTANTSRTLTGTVVDPATISISDGDPFDFNNVVSGSSVNHTFTLTNGGGVSATSLSGSGLGAPFTFSGGSFPGATGTCGVTLPVGTCTVVVTFAPTGTGLNSSTMSINFDNGTGAIPTESNGILGTGVDPAFIEISDGPVFDYGNQPLGITISKTFTLMNSGESDAINLGATALTAPYSFPGGAFPGGGTCTLAGSLTPTNSCTVVVDYNPTVSGAVDEVPSITYDDGLISTSAPRDIVGTG